MDEKKIVANLVSKFFNTLSMNPKTYEVITETLETMGKDILNIVFKEDNVTETKFTEPYEHGELFFARYIFDKCKYVDMDNARIWGNDSLNEVVYEDYFDDSEILWWECEGWNQLIKVLQDNGVIEAKYIQKTNMWNFYWNNGKYFWTDKIPSNAPIAFNIKDGEK